MIGALILAFLLSGGGDAGLRFSQDSAYSHLQVLAGDIGARPMGSPADHRALEYARACFERYGCDTSFVMWLEHGSRQNTSSGTAVGIKRGRSGPSICIGAHIDSDSPESPGANDDGSGSAIVLELARVFGNEQPSRTLIFCCFGGEEQGYEGSTLFLHRYEDIDSIGAMIQLDMADGRGVLEFDPHSRGPSAPWWLVKLACEEAGALHTRNFRYPFRAYAINYSLPLGAGSDQEPFLMHGIPAIAFISDINYPIHSPGDNLANFSPAGLARSGQLAENIIRRLQKNMGPRTTEQYAMVLLGYHPVFVPLEILWFVVIAATSAGVIALLNTRRRRLDRSQPLFRRWTTLKLLFYALLLSIIAWFAGDVLRLLNGGNAPWLAHPYSSWFVALGALMLGIWLAAWLHKFVGITGCPYALFKRAFFFLLIMTLASLAWSVLLAAYPALALLALSLAMLSRTLWIRALLVAGSVMALWLPIYSEWTPYVTRLVGEGIARAEGLNKGAFNLFFVLFFGVLILACISAAISFLRDSVIGGRVGTFLRSRAFLFIALASLTAAACAAMIPPSSEGLWQPTIEVMQTYDMDAGAKEIALSSTQSLEGAHIVSGAENVTIQRAVLRETLATTTLFDTALARIERKEHRSPDGDTLNIELHLSSTIRPYRVLLTYATVGSGKFGLSSPWFFLPTQSGYRAEWYSFPDTALEIPVNIVADSTMGVREDLRIIFAELAQPMTVSRQSTYVVPRTVYESSHTYRR